MAREFDDPYVPVLVVAAETQAVGAQGVEVAGGAVRAEIALDRPLGAHHGLGERTRFDGDGGLVAQEGTGERLDEKVVGVGVLLGVRDTGEPADVARELQQRVLESAACAQERDALLACGADRGEGPRLAAVRAAGQHPHRVEAAYRGRVLGVLGRDPVGVEDEAVAGGQGVQEEGDAGVGEDVRGAVADEGEASGLRRDVRHVLILGGPARSRPTMITASSISNADGGADETQVPYGILERMDPHLLRTYVTVARVASFSEAARELGYTQSAVSQHIAALEQDLGAPLLTRRPVAPTAAGERLLEHAGPLLLRLDAARADVVRMVGAPEHGLTLAATPTALGSRTLAALPAAGVTLRVLAREEIPAAVAQGRAELGLVDGLTAPNDPLRHPDVAPLTTYGVGEELVCVLLPETHPLARRDGLRLADLVDARWLDAPDAGLPLAHLRRANGSGASARPCVTRAPTCAPSPPWPPPGTASRCCRGLRPPASPGRWPSRSWRRAWCTGRNWCTAGRRAEPPRPWWTSFSNVFDSLTRS